MPSLLKTAFLQLNKWAGNEYPKREDFVSDNKKIDAFAEEVSSHMAQKTEIIVTQGIPVSQRKEGAFYLIKTDQSPITTVGNIKVSPMMGLRKE